MTVQKDQYHYEKETFKHQFVSYKARKLNSRHFSLFTYLLNIKYVRQSDNISISKKVSRCLYTCILGRTGQVTLTCMQVLHMLKGSYVLSRTQVEHKTTSKEIVSFISSQVHEIETYAKKYYWPRNRPIIKIHNFYPIMLIITIQAMLS